MTENFSYKLHDPNGTYWLRRISSGEKERLNDFLRTADAGNVFQSYEWGQLKKNNGWEPVYLALEKENRIWGAATILKRTIGGMTFFYSPRGPVLDYRDQSDLIPMFCEGVRPLAAREKAIFWRIDTGTSRFGFPAHF